MRSLYVADPVARWRQDADTTPLMVREALRRGGEAWVCSIDDLAVEGVVPVARARALQRGDDGTLGEVGPVLRQPLADFDVVHLRSDPPFDLRYYLATQVLELASTHTAVVNDPVALRGLNEKLAVLRFPELICETLVSADPAAIADFVAAVGGQAVLKPLYRCSGQGVLLLSAGPQLPAAIAAALIDSDGHVMVQRYLPEIEQGEARLTVIDGRVAGWMAKIPAPGNFLSNLDRGARVAACSYGDAEERVMARVGPFLRDHGIALAAVDIIGGYLSEINITSPGLLQQMNALNGSQLEVELQDHIETLVAARRPGRLAARRPPAAL